MTIEGMRSHIMAAYPGRSWKARCNVMSDQQVIAIYYSLVDRENKRILERKEIKRSSKPNHQLTIFDLGFRKEELE